MHSQAVVVLVTLVVASAAVMVGASGPLPSVDVPLTASTGVVNVEADAAPTETGDDQSAPTPIDSCRVIDDPGSYVLTGDVVSDPKATPEGFVCLLVTVSEPGHEVYIDGNGFSLSSSGRADTAVSVGSDGTTVVTDLELDGWETAIEASDPRRVRPGRVDSVELRDVVATDNRVAVSVDGAGHVAIDGGEFSGNRLGIGTSETSVAFSRLTVTDNERTGFAAAQTAGSVEGGAFSRNGADGLQFAISGPIEVRDVVASDNGGIGVSVAETSGFSLTDSDLSGNDVAGIALVGVADATIGSNVVVDNEVGVLLRDSLSDVVVFRNRIEGSADAGVLVSQATGGLVADNVLSNDVNVREADRPPFSTAPTVSWSLAPEPRLNVVEGAFVGGNYYASPSGDGFSEGCVDADLDTLCDSSLTLFEGAVDAHPLATPSVPADEPPLWVAPDDLRGHTFALTCSGVETLPPTQFGYGALARASVPPDVARFSVSNDDVLAAATNSPFGPAVRRLGVEPDDLLWAANPDDQVVRVFVDTRFGVSTCRVGVVA